MFTSEGHSLRRLLARLCVVAKGEGKANRHDLRNLCEVLDAMVGENDFEDMLLEAFMGVGDEYDRGSWKEYRVK